MSSDCLPGESTPADNTDTTGTGILLKSSQGRFISCMTS